MNVTRFILWREGGIAIEVRMLLTQIYKESDINIQKCFDTRFYNFWYVYVLVQNYLCRVISWKSPFSTQSVSQSQGNVLLISIEWSNIHRPQFRIHPLIPAFCDDHLICCLSWDAFIISLPIYEPLFKDFYSSAPVPLFKVCCPTSFHSSAFAPFHMSSLFICHPFSLFIYMSSSHSNLKCKVCCSASSCWVPTAKVRREGSHSSYHILISY